MILKNLILSMALVVASFSASASFNNEKWVAAETFSSIESMNSFASKAVLRMSDDCSGGYIELSILLDSQENKIPQVASINGQDVKIINTEKTLYTKFIAETPRGAQFLVDEFKNKNLVNIKISNKNMNFSASGFSQAAKELSEKCKNKGNRRANAL